jgi:hypothetical protein
MRALTEQVKARGKSIQSCFARLTDSAGVKVDSEDENTLGQNIPY